MNSLQLDTMTKKVLSTPQTTMQCTLVQPETISFRKSENLYLKIDHTGASKNADFFSSVPILKPRYCHKVDQKWQILLSKHFRKIEF